MKPRRKWNWQRGRKKKKSLSGTKRVKGVEYPSSFIVLRVRLNLWRAAVSGG